jgi:hypothetical protein
MSETTQTEPVRKAEVRAVQENPAGTMAPLEAMRTVVLFTITDAFGLVPEETMWAGYHLDDILAPLLDKTPGNVPLTVRQEMLDSNYSAALDMIEARDDRSTGTVWDREATHATVNDWASVTMQMISECYQMRPLEESAMHGKIVGLLRELGVDDPANPRPARYLPNDVRYRLNHRTG